MDVQRKSHVASEPRPPSKSVMPPPTTTSVASFPGRAPSVGSPDKGLIALTLWSLFAYSRFTPTRTEFVKLELKIWVSSKTANCRLVKDSNCMLSNRSGDV